MATELADQHLVHFGCRIPADLRERLQRMADARTRSASAEARLAIEDRLREFEAAQKEAA